MGVEGKREGMAAWAVLGAAGLEGTPLVGDWVAEDETAGGRRPAVDCPHEAAALRARASRL